METPMPKFASQEDFQVTFGIMRPIMDAFQSTDEVPRFTSFPITIPGPLLFKERGDTNEPYVDVSVIAQTFSDIRRAGNWPKDFLRQENLLERITSMLLNILDNNELEAFSVDVAFFMAPPGTNNVIDSIASMNAAQGAKTQYWTYLHLNKTFEPDEVAFDEAMDLFRKIDFDRLNKVADETAQDQGDDVPTTFPMTVKLEDVLEYGTEDNTAVIHTDLVVGHLQNILQLGNWPEAFGDFQVFVQSFVGYITNLATNHEPEEFGYNNEALILFATEEQVPGMEFVKELHEIKGMANVQWVLANVNK